MRAMALSTERSLCAVVAHPDARTASAHSLEGDQGVDGLPGARREVRSSLRRYVIPRILPNVQLQIISLFLDHHTVEHQDARLASSKKELLGYKPRLTAKNPTAHRTKKGPIPHTAAALLISRNE
ncbi:hypothetical protein ES702_00594 [subsurface metagenome]